MPPRRPRVSSPRSYLLRDIPLWFVGLLTNWMPDNPVICRLRGILARPFLGRCGRNLQIGTQVRFLSASGITIGDDVYVAAGCWLSGAGGLDIGNEVMFGPYCIIVTGVHQMKNGSARFGRSYVAPVSIGAGSWLAAHAVVTAGARVGKGCMVGANAVVTKDMPDNSFIGGIPARVISPITESPTEDQAHA